MLKVVTGASAARWASAATALESTPPLRKMPSGTSAIRRSFTASFRRSDRSATASSSPTGRCFGSVQ